MANQDGAGRQLLAADEEVALVRVPLENIRSDYTGFGTLARLASSTDSCSLETVEIDMTAVSFLAANMCSPLGAVLHRVARKLNAVRVTNLQPPVQAILERNRFLRGYGYAARPDTNRTTIQYTRMEPEDDRLFAEYVQQHLTGKGMPEMSPALAKRFRTSIQEIFDNAATHSRTKMGIFTCGQWFPNGNRLDFCVTDLGVGFRRNIREQRGLDLEPEEAIAWAVEGRNTTKQGRIPGGHGLKLLREFIALNKGRVQIVSGHGYWQQSANGSVWMNRLPALFPGTAVNIEINTADESSYCLTSEITPDQVF